MSESNGSHRILVVDDEPSIVDAVATALRYEGFTVREEGTGGGRVIVDSLAVDFGTTRVPAAGVALLNAS